MLFRARNGRDADGLDCSGRARDTLDGPGRSVVASRQMSPDAVAYAPPPEEVEKFKQRLRVLASHGMTLANVNAYAGTMLLRMASVRALMEDDVTAEQALITVIEEEVAAIADLPDGRILAELLASDERAHLPAKERQSRAGGVYFLDRAISGDTIRHRYEPRALERLARRILRREQTARDELGHGGAGATE